MINKKHSKKYTGGFTLVETLVAVLLLTTALSGPLTIAARSLFAASAARDQITAYYLAQDAIEYVRFARDTNKLHGSTCDWLTGSGCGGTINLSSCVGGACYFDSTGNFPSSPSPSACTSSTVCPLMYWDSGVGRFTYDTSKTPSPFTRIVTLTSVSGNTDERKISVTVQWATSNSVQRSVVVQENL